VSGLHRALVALLVISTGLFAVGVIAECSGEERGEPATAQVTEAEEGHADEGTADETHADKDEAVLGVDLESTPLIVLAVTIGLGLAALVATRVGRLPGFLALVASVALVWSALDVREFLHQLDESRTGIAIVALAVAALHFAAAAVSGWLAVRRSAPG
jgi:hypothetical protein